MGETINRPAAGHFAIRLGRSLLLGVIASCTLARADEIGVFALTGMYESDNPERVNSGGRRDTVGYATISNYGAWETGRLISHWNLAGSGVSYLHSAFGSKLYGDGTLRTTYTAISEILSWKLNEDFGQMVSNPLEPDTPLNRSNFNVFGTGPKLRIPMGMRTWMESAAFYTNSYFQGTGLGGDSTEIEWGINRSLVPMVSLGAFIGQTNGSTDLYGAYREKRASLRLAAKGDWTKVVANVGVNRAERPVRTANLPFFDLSAERILQSGSKVQLRISRVLTNLAQEFGRTDSYTPVSAATSGVLGAAPGSALDLNTTADLFNASTVRAAFYTKHRRTEWSGGLSWRKEDPLAGRFGDHRRYATVDLSYYRIWGSKTGIRFYGSYGITRGEQHPDQYDHQSIVGCEFAKPITGERFRWVATLERATRSSNYTGLQYTEVRVGFYLRYSKFIYQRE